MVTAGMYRIINSIMYEEYFTKYKNIDIIYTLAWS